MSRSNSRSKTAGVLVLGFVVLAVGLRMWEGSRKEDSAQPKKQVCHEYRIDLVDQEEATPGKLITASGPGQPTAIYRCSAQDAAVAVVFVTDSDPDERPPVTFGPATDPQGHRYSTNLTQLGGLCFVAIHRGFSKTPTSITFKASILETEYSARMGPPATTRTGVTTPITVTKIAPPERVLAVPSPKAAKLAESEAVAEYLEREGRLDFRFAAKQTSNSYNFSEILATSFCPPSERGDASSLALEPWEVPDVVQIRLHRIQNDDLPVLLTYKDAEIHTVNGTKILVFPTAQKIGSILGFNAFVDRRPESSYSMAMLKHSLGVISLQLSEQPKRGNAFDGYQLESVDISPSVEALGLERVRVDANIIGLSSFIRSGNPHAAGGITMIPQLKLLFHYTRVRTVSSKILVLPVHRVQDDPEISRQRQALFHRVLNPVRMTNGFGGAAGMGAMRGGEKPLTRTAAP